MDSGECETFRSYLVKYCAWTQSMRFEARAPPFDENAACAVFELYRSEQWNHLLECERCRDLNSYTDPCLRYEAAMWMDMYSHECWTNNRDHFLSATDPVIKVVVQGEFGGQFVEHARTCQRHQHEYQGLKDVLDEIMAASKATIKIMAKLSGVQDPYDVH